MADKRISQLVDRGTVANNDVVPIVVSGATTTNKATISSIQTFMQGNLDLGVTSVGITLGSSGTDVNVTGSPITSSGNITINFPTASAVNRGLLSAADWTTFNSKQQAITLTTTGTSGAATLVSGTLNIPNYSTDLSGYVTLNTTQTITAQKTFTTSGSSDTMIISHGSGSGFALDVLKAGNGEAIRVTKSSGSGNAMTISGGNFEAGTIVKTGGTSSQFLKADGSVDSTAYTTNTGTVTSVSGTGTVSGLSLSGTVTTSGNLTLGGTLSLTSANVTDALGFTPYNATNPAGYTTNVGTVTSVAASAGTGISISGSPITSSGTLTITNTAPDQVVSLTASTGISVSGTYPNFTITNTSPASGSEITGTGTANIIPKFTGGSTLGDSSLQNVSNSISNLNPPSGQFAWQLNGNATTGQSFGALVVAGTNASDIAFAVRNTGGVTTLFEVQGDGNVGIGTNSPDVTGFGWKTLTIKGGTASGDAGVIELQSPSTTGAANLGIIAFMDGSNRNAQIFAQRDSSTTTGNLLFATNGGAGILERMRITSGGYLKASNDGSYQSVAAGYHELRTNKTDDWIVYNTNTSASPYGLKIDYSSSVPNNADNWFIYCTDSTTIARFRVASNGNVTNVNGSYGAISDAKLKENIEDATPKLDDLMKVKVRNYNLIGDDKKQIGVIAQELEEVFPAMIDESEDFEEVEIPQVDEEGNEILNEEGEIVTTKERVSKGTTTKSVKYSVFVPMLIKAIQELKTEIDSLKNQIK